MDTIFGLPLSGLMVGLLIALGVCLAMVVWVAWRRPVIFKMGIRNIPRRKAQTILIVVGLMLSTLIISAALGTGDTVDYSLTKDVYDNYGNVDTLVVQSQQFDAPYIDRTTKIDAGALAVVEAALAGNENVDGIMPLLDEHVPVQNLTKNQAEPNMVVTGVDPARLDQFGGLTAIDGSSIDLATIATGEVVLSEKAADDLDATVGDTVAIFYGNTSHELTVAAIAQDSYLSGYRRGREDYLEYPGLVMPLTALQDLTGQAGTLSAIAVSGTGGVRDGLTHSDDIKDALRPALTGTGLGVDHRQIACGRRRRSNRLQLHQHLPDPRSLLGHGRDPLDRPDLHDAGCGAPKRNGDVSRGGNTAPATHAAVYFRGHGVHDCRWFDRIGAGSGRLNWHRQWNEAALRTVRADHASRRTAKHGGGLLPGRRHYLPDRRGVFLEGQPAQYRGRDPRHPRCHARSPQDQLADFRRTPVGWWRVHDPERTRERQGDSLLHRSEPGAGRTGADRSVLRGSGPSRFQSPRHRNADPLALA